MAGAQTCEVKATPVPCVCVWYVKELHGICMESI